MNALFLQKLGMNLGAVSRIQINTMVRRAAYISQVSPFKDGTILPVAWIETVSFVSSYFLLGLTFIYVLKVFVMISECKLVSC